MKFKAQDKQNQLIENITVHHLVVGVDIAQDTHVARAVSFRGIALGTPLAFNSHLEGFEQFGRSRIYSKPIHLTKSLSVWNLPVITG